MRDWFVVAGCPRGGNTLLRLMLDSHPEIHCLDGDVGGRVLLNGCVPPWVDAPVVGFKVPRWTSGLSRAYPGWRGAMRREGAILFPVRDVRACVASMRVLQRRGIKLLRNTGEWIRQLITRDPVFAWRYDAEIGMALDAGGSDELLSALAWKYCFAQWDACMEPGYPIMPVSFEELVRAPEAVMRRVCGHVGVEWNARVLQWQELTHVEMPSQYGEDGSSAFTPLSETDLDSWREELCEEEVQAILAIAGEANARAHRLAAAEASVDTQMRNHWKIADEAAEESGRPLVRERCATGL